MNKLELVFWHLNRYDTIRASIANRSAIVISADALLLAGTTFLLDKALLGVGQRNLLEQVIITCSIVTTLGLLCLSITYATIGIANVWKQSRNLYGTEIPLRLFFGANDTVKEFTKYQAFSESFRNLDEDQILTHALGELYTLIQQQFDRYQKLRWAIRFLFFSIIFFTFSVLVLLKRLF